MKYRITVPVAALAVTVLAAATALVPATPAAAASSGDFVSRINSLRASKGLPSLTVNSSLSSFAQSWTQKMANAGAISHNPSLSSAPGSWTAIAENVGVGGSADSIFNALVASSGHYANMTNAKYNTIGVGVVTGSDGRIYTTHNFAAYPSSAGSGSGSTTKTTSTTAKKSTTTAAPKTTTAPTTTPTRTSTESASGSNSNSEASSATTPETAAPADAPAPTPEIPTPALPQPSERIVQGLMDVGSIATQG